MTWDPDAAGVLRLPSGRLVRGRGLRGPFPAGPLPAFGLYLLDREPSPVAWESRWLRWPDFRLPAGRAGAAAFREAWERAAHERVEVACGGGQGRSGTALACLAVLDGAPPRARRSPMSGSAVPGARSRRPGSGASSCVFPRPRAVERQKPWSTGQAAGSGGVREAVPGRSTISQGIHRLRKGSSQGRGTGCTP